MQGLGAVMDRMPALADTAPMDCKEPVETTA
jgi:hypothetical protein